MVFIECRRDGQFQYETLEDLLKGNGKKITNPKNMVYAHKPEIA